MRIQINHTSYCFESRYSIEEIALIEEINPDALELWDEVTKDLLYTIRPTDSPVCYESCPRFVMEFYVNSILTGHAVCACNFPKEYFEKFNPDEVGTQENVKYLKHCIAKEVGPALDYMNRIEGQIATALDEYYASVLNMESMMDVPVFDSLPDESDDIETGEND